MEKNTETQILEELKEINRSLQEIKLESNQNNQEEQQGTILIGMVKSLLTGVFIVGPAIAVAVVMIQVIGSFVF